MKRHQFSSKSKLAEEIKIIDIRTIHNFYGDGTDRIPALPQRKHFIPNIYPTHEEIYKINIADLVHDMPRKYQIELYAAALYGNTICYLPTGSGNILTY